jgi:hypothetical protein
MTLVAESLSQGHKRETENRSHKRKRESCLINRCQIVPEADGFLGVVPPESSMMWLAMATHASQMYTFGPATSLETSAALLPQKEHASRLRKNIVATSE